MKIGIPVYSSISTGLDILLYKLIALIPLIIIVATSFDSSVGFIPGVELGKYT